MNIANLLSVIWMTKMLRKKSQEQKENSKGESPNTLVNKLVGGAIVCCYLIAIVVTIIILSTKGEKDQLMVNQQFVLVSAISLPVSFLYFGLVKLQYDVNKFNKHAVHREDGQYELPLSQKIRLIYFKKEKTAAEEDEKSESVISEVELLDEGSKNQIRINKSINEDLDEELTSKEFDEKVAVKLESTEKKTLSLDQSILSFAVLTNMKENQENFYITSNHQKHIFKVTFLVISLQFFITLVMTVNIYKEFTTLKSGVTIQDFDVIIAKLLTTLTLHIFLFPAFENTLNLMKYINNHHSKFENPFVCFYLATITMVIFWICEFINLMILYSKTSAFNTVNSFVTQTCVISVQTLYYGSMFGRDGSNKLKKVFDTMPAIEWRSCQHSFRERCTIGKLNRLIYLVCRFKYVVILYYFGPHIYMLVNQFRCQINAHDMMHH